MQRDREASPRTSRHPFPTTSLRRGHSKLPAKETAFRSPRMSNCSGLNSNALRERTGETINGATTKTEWAKKVAKVSMRHIQYIRKDGNRKGQTRTTVRVKPVELKEGMVVRIDDRKLTLTSRIIEALWLEAGKKRNPHRPRNSS